MLKEEKGIASIWFGTFETEEDVVRYVEEVYDEHEESHSDFRRDFNLGWYDDDFQEVGFSESPAISPAELATGHSYWDSFAAALPCPSGFRANAIVIIYDYRFKPTDAKSNSPLQFLCAVPYQDLNPRPRPWLEIP